MIDFACKKFDLNDIVKCGLGLTKADFKIMEYFIENSGVEFTTHAICKTLNFNLTTVQKAVKKLSEKKIIIRRQKNLDNGGYLYTYKSVPKPEIRQIIKSIIRNWSTEVEKNIDKW